MLSCDCAQHSNPRASQDECCAQSQDNILRYRLVTCFSESTIPTIVQSVGVSSRLKGKLASLPRHQNTNSPTPAPTESTATIGLPAGSRSLFRVWTTRSLRPSSESFLMVATTVPITRASCIVAVTRETPIRH